MPAGYSALKAAQTAAFLALEQGGSADFIKTVKLVYLADRRSLDLYNRPILFDDFYCLDHGPIDTYTVDLFKQKGSKKDQEVWNRYVTKVNKSNWQFGVAADDISFSELSDNEEKILTKVVRRFESFAPFELVDWVHDHCREWSNPRGTCRYLSYYDILKALGKEDIEKKVKRLDSMRMLKHRIEEDTAIGADR